MIQKLKNVFGRGTENGDSEGDNQSEARPDVSHSMAVSPSSVRIESGTIRSGSKWCKTMFISDWPDTASPAMLEMVTTHPSSEVDVSMHVSPTDQQRAIDEFDGAIRDLKIQQRSEKKGGNPSTQTQRRIREHKEVLSQLEDNQQSVFGVSVYITIRTETEDRTEKVARKIANKLSENQIHATAIDYRQEDGLSSGSPIAKDVLSYDVPDVSTKMLGRGVGALFPFSATTLIEEDGIMYGQHTTTGSPVIVDRYNRDNGYNILSAGVIGAGKSYGTKLQNLRQIAKDRDTILIMLDPLDGFKELAEGLNAERVTVDGTKGINPLEIQETPQHVLDQDSDIEPFRQAVKDALGFFEQFFNNLDSGPDTLSKTERGVLSEAVRNAYAQKGITADPSTHSNDSPTVMDVTKHLAEIESDAREYIERMEDADELIEIEDMPEPSERYINTWEQAAADLRVAMHPFRTAEYANLAGESDIDIHGSKVTYLDLQQGEGDREMGLMMQLLLDAIYQRTKTTDKRVILCIDEAHYMMQNESTLEWLERLTRHSRHHDLSLHLVTQEASDFFIHEKAKTIADNCSQKILYRLPGLSNEDAEALGLSEREAKFVRNARAGSPERGYSNALVNVQDGPTLPLKVWAWPKEESVIEGENRSSSPSNGRGAVAGGDD